MGMSGSPDEVTVPRADHGLIFVDSRGNSLYTIRFLPVINGKGHNLFHCMEDLFLIQGKSDIFSGGWHYAGQ
jgi:hypothetical protein